MLVSRLALCLSLSLLIESTADGCCVSHWLPFADAGTRNPAIATVRAWVPDNKPWSSTIRTFALQVLRRLQSVDAKARESENGGEQMEGVEGVEEGDGELSETGMVQEEADQIAQSQYLPVKLEMPVEQEVVRQHVELMFALTKKIPEFLDE